MGELHPDQQARALYLVLLGMALAIYLFSSYRHRLATALQHAAIWALIIVGGVLAYGFKDQLIATLMPSQAQRVDTDTVAFERARDGHFYATLEVNGADIDFLIDTGATAMVLSRQAAERAGFEPDRLNYTRSAQTANGRVRGAPVRLERVALGPFVDHDVPAVVNGGDLDISLLGMSYLDRYSGLRVEGDRLLLNR